jgi:hypothetical protein
MPVVTPCATPVRRQSHRPGISSTSRAFGRHFGDIPEAPTYLRIDGVWVSVKTPSQDQIDSADLMIQGGHLTDVSAAVRLEVLAAGLCLVTDGAATATGAYPSMLTFPSAVGTFPIADDDDPVVVPDDGPLLPSALLLPSSTTYPDPGA